MEGVEAAEELCGLGGNAVIRQAISCDICGTEKKQTNHWFVAYDQGGELRVSGWNSRNRLRPGSKHLCGQTCLHKLVDDFMARAISARPPQSAAEEAELDETVVVAENRREIRAESRAEARPETRPETRSESRPETRIVAARPVEAKTVEAKPIETKPAETRAAVVARAVENRIQENRIPESRLAETRMTDTSLIADLAYDIEFESSARLITPPEPVVAKKPLVRPAPELVAVQGRLRSEEIIPVLDETPRFASRNWRAEAWEREREREQRAVNQHREIGMRRHSS